MTRAESALTSDGVVLQAQNNSKRHLHCGDLSCETTPVIWPQVVGGLEVVRYNPPVELITGFHERMTALTRREGVRQACTHIEHGEHDLHDHHIDVRESQPEPEDT